jgi:predicted kinase
VENSSPAAMKTNKQILFILCGEAFSGKTTLAKKLANWYTAKIVGRDEVYFALEKILELENTSEEDDDKLWDNLWPISIQGVKNQVLLGNSVVVDDNCLYLKQRDELRSIAKENGVKSILIFLDVSTDILKERKKKNKTLQMRHDVPSGWLEEDSKTFERPTETESPVIYGPNEAFEDLIPKLERLLI